MRCWKTFAPQLKEERYHRRAAWMTMHWNASVTGHNTSHIKRSTSHDTCHTSFVNHTPPAATLLGLAQLLCSRKIMRSNDPSPNAKCGAALKSAATQLQLAARNSCTSSVTEYLEARQTAHGDGQTGWVPLFPVYFYPRTPTANMRCML
jgi:hypothetical protein